MTNEERAREIAKTLVELGRTHSAPLHFFVVRRAENDIAAALSDAERRGFKRAIEAAAARAVAFGQDNHDRRLTDRLTDELRDAIRSLAPGGEKCQDGAGGGR